MMLRLLGTLIAPRVGEDSVGHAGEGATFARLESEVAELTE